MDSGGRYILADSAYSHLVLGNFFPDSLTTAFQVGDTVPLYGITSSFDRRGEVIPLGIGCNGVHGNPRC